MCVRNDDKDKQIVHPQTNYNSKPMNVKYTLIPRVTPPQFKSEDSKWKIYIVQLTSSLYYAEGYFEFYVAITRLDQ